MISVLIAKMVRGAYLTPETVAAKSGNYPSPIHDSFEATNQSYNSMIHSLMLKVTSDSNRQLRFIVATQNEDSIRHAVMR